MEGKLLPIKAFSLDIYEGETPTKRPHITTVMRGLMIYLAGLATSCSARKQIELELQ